MPLALPINYKSMNDFLTLVMYNLEKRMLSGNIMASNLHGFIPPGGRGREEGKGGSGVGCKV